MASGSEEGRKRKGRVSDPNAREALSRWMTTDLGGLHRLCTALRMCGRANPSRANFLASPWVRWAFHRHHGHSNVKARTTTSNFASFPTSGHFALRFLLYLQFHRHPAGCASCYITTIDHGHLTRAVSKIAKNFFMMFHKRLVHYSVSIPAFTTCSVH